MAAPRKSVNLSTMHKHKKLHQKCTCVSAQNAISDGGVVILRDFHRPAGSFMTQ
jgi:hypothetical protein